MKRLSLYSSVLPRVRSNSLSTLAVVQPPTPSSTSRPAPKQSQHSQLALTHVQPSQSLHPALISYAPQITTIPIQPPSLSSLSTPHSDQPRNRKRPRLNYQLDVGAYGIPKSHRHHRSLHTSGRSNSNAYPHTSLSVQVGEDAYFIRGNAMGIADGVGGWAKSANHTQSPHLPTPSALFSRRLMHFCSAELDSLSIHQSLNENSSSSQSTTRPPSVSKFSFTHHLKPPPAQPSPYPPIHDTFSFDDELSSSLQELSEGIDVLNILEHAYNSTLKAHTNPALPIPTPLTTGSSTALLAVLDHPPQVPSQDSKITLHQSPSSQRNYAAGSLPQDPHPTFTYDHKSLDPVGTTPAHPIPSESPSSTNYHYSTNISAGSHPEDSFSKDAKSTSHAQSQDVQQQDKYDAVLRIAHLGDCMGMLVRDDSIVWRSDEMWWGYNHPLQLGPIQPDATSTSTLLEGGKVPMPTQPHTFTLPVKEDDILILASDGLSDNLWDDDILDEVIKFRQGFNWDDSPSTTTSTSPMRSRSSSPSSRSSSSSSRSSASSSLSGLTTPDSLSESLLNFNISSSSTTLRRKAFSGMLSEALCSRAKRVSERRGSRSTLRNRSSSRTTGVGGAGGAGTPCDVIQEETSTSSGNGNEDMRKEEEEEEIPFARRARMSGKVFRGGKPDDISVVVAIISPVDRASRVKIGEQQVD